MAANISYKTCVCGQRFSSEVELARHQKTCPHYRRAKVDAELIEPLRKEASRLNGEADGIYVGVAQAFGHYALGDTGEAKYKLKVARDQHEHALGYLTNLVNEAAEVAKNRDAMVSRLQTQLKDLSWRYSDLNSLLTTTTKLVSERKG